MAEKEFVTKTAIKKVANMSFEQINWNQDIMVAWLKQLQLYDTLAGGHLFYQPQEISRVCGIDCRKKGKKA